jgi:ribose 5-phosphate isomerase B
MSKKTIALASDHAGFEKKEIVKEYFDKKGIAYKDFGCFSAESVDYPDFGHLLGKAIDSGEYETGISFCGSGQGISMVANKYPNVRSALCWNAEIARLAREHNKANVCAVPGRFVTREETLAIVETFLSATFEGGRHLRRIKKIPIH